MKLFFKGIVSILLGAVLIGCKAKKEVAQQQDVINGTWELTEQSGMKDLIKAYPEGLPTLTFENASGLMLYGYDGCNNIKTKATLKKEHQISIDAQIIATMMSCNKTKDADFKSLLAASTSYELTENVLTLKGEKGTLKFHRIALNGKWVLNKVFFGTIKAKDLYPYKKPFISIDINTTRVSGSTACNTISGQLLIYRNTMKFNHLLTTKMFCEGVNEKLFTDALAKTTHYKLEGTRLTLLENNKPILELVRQFDE